MPQVLPSLRRQHRQLRQILYDAVSARKLVQALLFLWQLQHSVCLREQALVRAFMALYAENGRHEHG